MQQYVTVKKSFTIVTKLFILDVSGSHGYTYDCKQLIQSIIQSRKLSTYFEEEMQTTASEHVDHGKLSSLVTIFKQY